MPTPSETHIMVPLHTQYSYVSILTDFAWENCLSPMLFCSEVL